jgi:hypothetical protein
MGTTHGFFHKLVGICLNRKRRRFNMRWFPTWILKDKYQRNNSMYGKKYHTTRGIHALLLPNAELW